MGGVGRLLRSASFERKRGGRNAAQQVERSTTTNGPRGSHSVLSSGITESEASSSGGSHTESEWRDDGRPLRGWLHKRHARQATTQAMQWAGRYFAVDEARGTLSYAKGESRKPSVILPLADITEVKPLETGGDVGNWPWCFMISCPPVHCTVRANDADGREMWLHGLRSRSATWKARLTPGAELAPGGNLPRVPDIGFTTQRMADVMGADAGASPPVSRWQDGLPPADAPERASQAEEYATGGDHWGGAARPPDQNAEQGCEATPGATTSRLVQHQHLSSTSTVELESDDEETKLTGRDRARLTRKALGLSADEWGQYTQAEQAEFLELELWVEGNKEAYDAVSARSDGDSARNSGGDGRGKHVVQHVVQHGPAGAPRDLADMLSSDEEIEHDTLDDIAPVRMPPPASSSCCAAALASPPPPPHEPSREPIEPACCSAAPSEAGGVFGGYGSNYSSVAASSSYVAAPPPRRLEAASAEPMAWLSALPDSAYDDADAVRDAELDAELDAHLGLEARPPRAAELAAPYEPTPHVPTPYAPAQYEPAQYEPAQYEPAQYEPAQYAPAQHEPAPYEPAPYAPQLAPPLASEPYPVEHDAPYPEHETHYQVEPPPPPIGQTHSNSWDSNHGNGPAAVDALLAHSTTDGRAIAVGQGIEADDNFLDDDWDED